MGWERVGNRSFEDKLHCKVEEIMSILEDSS